MEMLLEKGAEVIYNDPWIPELKPSRKYDFKMKSVPLMPDVLSKTDAVIIITDHSDYDFAEIVKHSHLVIDTRNATGGLSEGREKIVMA